MSTSGSNQDQNQDNPQLQLAQGYFRDGVFINPAPDEEDLVELPSPPASEDDSVFSRELGVAGDMDSDTDSDPEPEEEEGDEETGEEDTPIHYPRLRPNPLANPLPDPFARAGAREPEPVPEAGRSENIPEAAPVDVMPTQNRNRDNASGRAPRANPLPDPFVREPEPEPTAIPTSGPPAPPLVPHVVHPLVDEPHQSRNRDTASGLVSLALMAGGWAIGYLFTGFWIT